MADSTISLTIAGETPTVVTLLALTRADTGAAVGFGSGVFTLAGGAWIKTFTPPETGIDYHYTFRLTWADASTDDQAASIFVPGLYLGSRTGIEDIYGIDNARSYADLQGNNDTDYISGRFDRALDEAQSYTESRWRKAGLTWPVAADFVYRSRLVAANNEYGGAWLYFGRSMRDQDSRFVGADGSSLDGLMSGHLKHAQAEIDWVIANASEDDGELEPGGWATVPVNRGVDTTLADEFSG